MSVSVLHTVPPSERMALPTGSRKRFREMLVSLFVDSCFYPAERARSGPDE
jgi:hypothetical protein